MDVVFPSTDNWIIEFVYWMIESILSWGWLSYGFAIIFMTLFIKLIMSPLDFLNRYFTRKNQLRMQEFAPEEEKLKKIYANDPMAYMKARSELHRRDGNGGSGGMALVMLTSVVLSMIVFFNVFGALGDISNANLNQQYAKLEAVYDQYSASGEETLKAELNEEFDNTTTPFLWVKNIWRSDSMWTDSVMTFEEYQDSFADGVIADSEKAKYEEIYGYIDADKKGMNGWLILVIMVALASWGSMKLTTYMTSKNAPKKTTTEAEKVEPIITYSLRDAKEQSSDVPNIDPAQVGNMMQVIMPVILIFFAIGQTAAFAVYMISSSVITTGLNMLYSWATNLMLKNQKPKVKIGGFDSNIINPHAKYFKGGK